MLETQIGSVQSHSADFALVDDRWLSKRAAVFDVTANRMAKLCQVDADLVGATRFQSAFQFAVGANFSHRLKVRDGSIAFGFVGGASSQPVASVANELRGDRLVFDRSRDQRKVTSYGVVMGELLDDFCLGFLVASKDKQPAGVAINSVYRQQSRILPVVVF